MRGKATLAPKTNIKDSGENGKEENKNRTRYSLLKKYILTDCVYLKRNESKLEICFFLDCLRVHYIARCRK